ncbi:hypothetical protein RQP46_004831 [Phenoliferia psychrophenolica]
MHRSRVSVTNPDIERSQDSPAPSSASPGLKGGFGAVPLTASVTLLPLGSRFLRQILEQPRFVLVGTEEDLVPALGSVPLRTASSSSDAVVLRVWTGLGVLQLEVYIEKPDPAAKRPLDSPRGVVFALVAPPGDLSNTQLRMWSLTSLVNLAKWRCFNEASEPIVMAPLQSPAPPRASHDLGKRSSKAFFKSFFTGEAPPRHQSATAHGKARAMPPPPPPNAGPPVEAGYIVVGASQLQEATSKPSMESSRRSREIPAANDAPRTPSDTSESPATTAFHRGGSVSSQTGLLSPATHGQTISSMPPPETTNSLPSEWAHSSVAMPLPRGHSSILFFQLSSVPAKDPDPLTTGDADTLKCWDDAILYLAVATSRVIYLFESRPSEKRTWVASNEFYAPATPRFLTLVQTDPSLIETARNLKRSSTASASSPTSASSLGELCIFLGMRRESVLIRLPDLSVREIDLAPSSRHGGRPTSRAGSATSARSAMASAVGYLVESRQELPPGILPSEQRNVARGRRHAPGDLDGGDDGAKEDWIGCEELVFPTRPAARAGAPPLTRRLYLLSKELSTSVVLSPLGCQRGGLATEGPLPRPGGAPPPINLRPIHTFTWPSAVNKVVALLPSHTLKPDVDPHLLHLILVGFMKTGVHVIEGTISKDFVEEHIFRPHQSSPPTPRAFFTPMRSHAVSPLISEAPPASIDSDLLDKASYDWNRATGLLCLGEGGWDHTQSSPLAATAPTDDSNSDSDDDFSPKVVTAKRPRGVYLWTAAHSDFQLKFLG